MKKLFLLIVILSSMKIIFGQNEYYDALYLNRYIKNGTLSSIYNDVKNKKEIECTEKYKSLIGNKKGQYIDSCLKIINSLEEDTIFSVLKKYFAIDVEMKIEEINNILHRNPFFAQINYPGSLKDNNYPLQSLSFSSLSKYVGGLDVTNFADGVAKFMVERFKQELSAAFFEKFKDDLSDPKYTDLKILFPETEKTLMTIDKDIYQFSAYLNTLRQSCIKDLTNQWVNLQQLLNQQKYKDYFYNQRPELGTILYTSFYIINGLSSGKHPGDILADYDPYKYIKIKDNRSLDSNMIASIKIIKLFSSSLRSVSLSNYWVPADSVRLLLQNDLTLKIYLGLIYQQGAGINFIASKDGDNTSFQQVLAQAAPLIDSLNKFKYFVETFINNAQEVDEYIRDMKEKKKSEIDYNDYFKLFGASLDLFDHTKDFVDLPYVKLGESMESKIKNTSSKLLFVARSSGELFIDVRTKNYSSGIMNVISILDTLIHYKDNTRKYVLKYGSFIASIAESQNSDDVRNAIESVALPAGSYSVKRNSKFNIALNGYLGFGYDFCDPFGKSDVLAARNKFNLNYNIYAPVGISFSTALICKGHVFKANRSCGSGTIFLSLIDVGSIANFRINDDTTLLKRTITISDIFSPGISVIYGIPNYPVSFSLGCIYKPKLIYNNRQSNFVDVPGMLRFNFAILIDIPFFNFKSTRY